MFEPFSLFMLTLIIAFVMLGAIAIYYGLFK